MGELDQYLDLYLAEAQEHLDTLNRGILELESGGGGDALDAAFRAAHTVKGMSAMMGHNAVAEVAHRLEDRLDHVRAGRVEVDPGLIDDLLAGADELARAIDQAVADGGATAGDSPAAGDPVAAPAVSEGAPEMPVPEAAELVVRVVLAAECQLKGARALVVCRNVARVCDLVGTSPVGFDERFGGELWLFVGPGADTAAVERVIRSGGEVARVDFLPVGDAAPRESEAVPAEEESTDASAVRAATGLIGARHVKVDRRQLIDIADGMGDLAILSRRLERSAGDSASAGLREVVEGIGRRVRELQAMVLGLRMVPAAVVFDRLPRVVRDTARSLGKEVDFYLEGRDIQLDREILEELVDALVHILRNAIDHGIEEREGRIAAGKPPRGRLVLKVVRERSSVLIEVDDDGRGVDRSRVFERARSLGLMVPSDPQELEDEDLLRLLSQPGFSTADRVSSVSGRGVGMDAVVTRIRALGGGVSLRSVDGKGATFLLRLPITLALVQALRARVGEEEYAIPITHVTEALNLDRERVVRKGERDFIRHRGGRIPIVRLGAVLGTPSAGAETAAIVTELGDRRAALAVDGLAGREQIIVKTFDAAVGTLKVFSGAALLADGRPVLVLDPISVI